MNILHELNELKQKSETLSSQITENTPPEEAVAAVEQLDILLKEMAELISKL